MSQIILDDSNYDTCKLDDQNPYLGLHPFREKDKIYFFGREKEISELFHRIQINVLTVVFGKSGMGKTSLLRAGLIPKLKKNRYLPIYIRTRFDRNNEKSPLDQVKSCIEKKIREVDKKAIPIAGLTLWEYFQKVQVFGGLVKPLLIFDPFENIFNLGKDIPEKMNPLIIEIGDLVQDWVPVVVQEKFKDKRIPYQNVETEYRVVFSLREDYLPLLMNLYEYMPSVIRGQNHYRLLPMKGGDAINAVKKPGEKIIEDEKVAIKIIKQFPKSKDSDYIPFEIHDDSWENWNVEPFLLNLFCYNVNQKRKKANAAKISLELLKHVSYEDAVTEHYEEVIEKCEQGTQKAIEIELLTPGGERKLQDLNSLKSQYNVQKKDLDKLVNERILREKKINNITYIELIHDVLAPVIKEKRDKRLKEIENQKLREKLKKRYYRIFVTVSLVLAIIFFVIAAIAILETIRATEEFRNAQLSRLTAETLLEFPKDNTRAIRIAEAAYQMEMPAPSPDRMKILSDIGYSFYERPFHITDLHHKDAIYAAVFSLDGTRMLTASADNTARLWDIDGKQLKDFKHKARVSSAEFSPAPNENHILTASWDKTAKIWNFQGEMLVNFPHNAVVISATYSHDGTRIITTSRDGMARVWDIKGKEQFSIEHDGVFSAVFSPDDTLILTASWDKTAKVWNDKGKLLFPLVHNSALYSVVFSPDGKKVLCAAGDGTVTLWTLEDKSSVKFKLQGEPASARFFHDGSKILIASRDGTVSVRNLDGSRTADFKSNSELYSAASSPDDRQILTAGEDGTAKVWELKNNILADVITLKADVKKVVFSPDNSQILTASTDGFARLWDREGKKCLQEFRHKDMVSSAVFSPDAEQILTASGKMATLWDLEANRLRNFPHPEEDVTSVAFAPDGKRILTTSGDGTAKVWTQEQKKPLLNLRHETVVTYGVFSHDNQWILTASADGFTRVWDLQGNAVLKLKHKGRLFSCEFSPDDKLILTASADSTVKIFNRKGEELLELKHSRPVAGAVFSNDGQRILAASNDGTVKLWDFKGNLLAEMDKHTDAVNSAVFSKDDRWILSASQDKTVKLWKSPEAIFDSLKEAKIPPLSDEDKRKLGIQNDE